MIWGLRLSLAQPVRDPSCWLPSWRDRPRVSSTGGGTARGDHFPAGGDRGHCPGGCSAELGGVTLPSPEGDPPRPPAVPPTPRAGPRVWAERTDTHPANLYIYIQRETLLAPHLSPGLSAAPLACPSPSISTPRGMLDGHPRTPIHPRTLQYTASPPAPPHIPQIPAPPLHPTLRFHPPPHPPFLHSHPPVPAPVPRPVAPPPAPLPPLPSQPRPYPRCRCRRRPSQPDCTGEEAAGRKVAAAPPSERARGGAAGGGRGRGVAGPAGPAPARPRPIDPTDGSPSPAAPAAAPPPRLPPPAALPRRFPSRLGLP